MKIVMAGLALWAGLMSGVGGAAEPAAPDRGNAIPDEGAEAIPLDPAKIRIIVHAVDAKSIHGGPVRFELTDPVYVIKTRKNLSLVRSMETIDDEAGPPTWIPSADLADMAAFKPLAAWPGVRQCKFTSGDEVLTYAFMPDARFELDDPQWWSHGAQQPGATPTRFFTGRLYQAGEVIWARTDKTGDEVFWFARHKFALKANGQLYSVWFNKACGP